MKPQPVLDHMPLHVKEKIVDLSNTDSKMTMRLCTKDFKELVDQSSIHYDSVWVTLSHQSVEITVLFDKYAHVRSNMKFEKNGQACKITNEHTRTTEQRGSRFTGQETENYRTEKDGHFIDEAVKALTKILKNPRFTFRSLDISLHWTSEFDSFERFLSADRSRFMEHFIKNLNGRLIPAKRLEFSTHGKDSERNLFKVLGTVKPGFLKSITIKSWMKMHLHRVSEMEQFKMAKSLSIEGIELLHPLPVAKWSTFEYVRMKVQMFDLAMMNEIIKMFSTSPTIREVYLKLHDVNYQGIDEQLEPFIHDPERAQHVIPGELDRLEVYFSGWRFDVQKVNNNVEKIFAKFFG